MSDSHLPILLVEDNEDDVLAFRRAFRNLRYGHALHVVTDGRQALWYLRGEDKFSDRGTYPLPAMVFLDLKLPYHNGLEILERVRSTSELNQIPVVILSGSDERTDHMRADQLGISMYLVKPASANDLIQALEFLSLRN